MTINMRVLRMGFAAAIVPLAACSSGTDIATSPAVQAQADVLASSTPALAAQTQADTFGRNFDAAIAVGAAVPAAVGTRTYYDDFAKDQIGTDADGWRPLAGTWAVCLPPGESKEYCDLAPSGVTRPTIAGQDAWSDYSVDTATFRNVAANRNGGVMLLGRVVDGSHFYGLELRNDIRGTGREFWYIVRHDERGWRILTGAPFVTHADSYARLRMDFVGARISAFVEYTNGSSFTPLGSIDDAEFRQGGIGLRTWGNAEERFDDVRVTLFGAQPNPSPTALPPASPAPTVAPTAVPKPTNAPTASPTGPRRRIWTIGDAFQESDPGDGQIQEPRMASDAACNGIQCSGGSGPVNFTITRPNDRSPQNPGGSWRSMMILTNNVLAPGGTYDSVFQTTVRSPQDVQGSQNILWQDHSNIGGVNTVLGLENDGNGQSYWYMNTAGVDGYGNPDRRRTWQAPYTVGETDTWEIQWKNTTDSSGFVDLYRNGALVDRYDGPNVVAATAYDVVGFGVYEYHWENATNSSALMQDVTFNAFTMYAIPGRIAPVPVP